MTKIGRLLFVFLLLLCTNQLFADKKKVVEPTLEGEAKVQFDYAFMEGVRCKVLGDLKSAIAYFDQCMKIYNKSAAVRYELSSILVLGEDYTLPLQLMREAVEGMKNMRILEPSITIKSASGEDQRPALEALADAIIADLKG